MEFNDYLYQLVQFRINYLKDKIRFKRSKLDRPTLDAEVKQALKDLLEEYTSELVNLKWLLQLVDEGTVDIADTVRRHHDMLLKPLFKVAKRCKRQDGMPKSELCYAIFGCMVAEELLGVGHYYYS